MALSTSFCGTTAPLLRNRTPFTSSRQRCIRTFASSHRQTAQTPARREFLLHSVNVGVLASLFSFGAVDRPANLGIQDYGEVNGKRVRQLGLCPKSPNCVSTAEAANSMDAFRGGTDHYIPPWNYNPEEGRGSSISRAEAIDQLVEVASNIKPDNFEPTLIRRTDEYVYLEFQSPTFGFIDDVEFYFPADSSLVEYRSASRLGESDSDINRKRIRAIRKELAKKGWKSVGF